MTEPAESYISVDIQKQLRGQAYKVWGVTVVVVLVWVALILLPPVLAANGQNNISSPIYHFFSFICHQIPDRTFHIAGYPFAVCSRCFGVYFGLLLGLAIYPLWRNIDDIEALPRVWLFASMVPIGIDWSLTVFGIWENTFLTRFVTGLILGAACATYIIPALVEIIRYVRKPAH